MDRFKGDLRLVRIHSDLLMNVRGCHLSSKVQMNIEVLSVSCLHCTGCIIVIKTCQSLKINNFRTIISNQISDLMTKAYSISDDLTNQGHNCCIQ